MMGLTELKEKQKQAIVTFIQGQDTFVALLTEYGKSIMALNEYHYCHFLLLHQLCQSHHVHGLFNCRLSIYNCLCFLHWLLDYAM